MRRIISLLIGLGIAAILASIYMKFSGPLVYKEVVPTTSPAPVASADAHNWILYGIVLLSWITAFIPMPLWLATLFDIAFGWVACALFVVTGVFVWLATPNNTLQDGTYVAFLCSIAILASRLTRILRTIAHGKDD